MSQLTIVTLCHVLSNLTQNRCILAENLNVCRCFSDLVNPMSNNVVSAAPEMMMSEVVLIFFVLALWLSAIGFCLNQYKSLRRLETQVHYCVTRKDPLNIGEIKIVTREQDSIIYKKKRYSTVLEPQIDPERLKAMRYVQQYLPKTSILKTIPSNRTVTKSSDSPSSLHKVLTPHEELAEEQSTININETVLHLHRAGSSRLPTGLTVPHISSPSSFRSNPSETSRSIQHLSVPNNGLRSNRYSDGNISLHVPQLGATLSLNPHEELIDPRLIPESVRRSLLALHRESQENVYMQHQHQREKTQSENDVHGAFHPWKFKMQSKLKRTHHQTDSSSRRTTRPHSKTLSVLPVRHNSVEHESLPDATPVARRSLMDYPKFSTQSTSESETTHQDGDRLSLTSDKAMLKC